MGATKRKIGTVSQNGTSVQAKKAKAAAVPATEDSDEGSDITIGSDNEDSEDELDQSTDEEVSEDDEEDSELDLQDGSVADDGEEEDDEPKLPVKRKPLPLDPHKEAASREAHQKQKEKLSERKGAKPHADILARSKTLWAQINRKKVPKAERQKIIEELYTLISGSVVDIIFKHDASRVVQACFKFGSEAQRTTILHELKGRLVELSKSTYGKFLVVKMLYYGSAAHRDLILSEIHGNVRKLIKHKEAAYVVEDAFREYTTPAQQEGLVSEMYGAEFSVFESTGSKTLAKLLEESPEKRDTIMKNLWDSIEGSVKKGSIGFTIIHRALLSFLLNANAPAKADVVELVKELLPEIVHTKDGSEVACYIIALSAAKDRKAIMKSFRDHIVKAMTDEYGWMAVVSLFLCVDDTVLLTKAFMPDISKKCVDLFEDRFARKVFLYLLGDLQTRYFTAREMTVFRRVQAWKATTSKKEDSVRRSEILASLGDTLVTTLTENVAGMLDDPNAAPLLVEIVLHGPTDPGPAIEAIVAHFGGEDGSGGHGALKDHSPRFLKTLVQGGHFVKETGKIERSSSGAGAHAFAEALCPVVERNVGGWATGDGSFVVVSLLESLDREGGPYKSLISALRGIEGDITAAGTSGNKGAKLIASLI